ncbi:hypothetical protein [Ralstonia nicotianae]|uniref:Transmembrane protein n=1 Tax=Ralstonia nicotianae TaxID=3037696 RepID=A0ABX7ZUE1_9RALS|nr:hypothetical protein [Ralstonia nicotianae]QUP58790.1 hypothetical protein GO999_09555 [Ralstonia nicotianae]
MSLWPQIACVAQRVPAGKIGADGGAAWLAGVAAGALAAWAWLRGRFRLGPAVLEIGVAPWRLRRPSTPAGMPA